MEEEKEVEEGRRGGIGEERRNEARGEMTRKKELLGFFLSFCNV